MEYQISPKSNEQGRYWHWGNWKLCLVCNVCEILNLRFTLSTTLHLSIIYLLHGKFSFSLEQFHWMTAPQCMLEIYVTVSKCKFNIQLPYSKINGNSLTFPRIPSLRMLEYLIGPCFSGITCSADSLFRWWQHMVMQHLETSQWEYPMTFRRQNAMQKKAVIKTGYNLTERYNRDEILEWLPWRQ